MKRSTLLFISLLFNCLPFPDPPGEPKSVEIDKYDKSSVSLKWKAPDDDGGNPIQGKKHLKILQLCTVFLCCFTTLSSGERKSAQFHEL